MLLIRTLSGILEFTQDAKDVATINVAHKLLGTEIHTDSRELDSNIVRSV